MNYFFLKVLTRVGASFKRNVEMNVPMKITVRRCHSVTGCRLM